MLASAVALLHAAVVVLLLTGALFAVRFRHVLLVHAPLAVAVAAVHVAGADCPLTTWERDLRDRSGDAYDAGFLDHYVFGPLGLDVASPALQIGVYAIVLLPNLGGYGLLLTRQRRRRAVTHGIDGRRTHERSVRPQAASTT